MASRLYQNSTSFRRRRKNPTRRRKTLRRRRKSPDVDVWALSRRLNSTLTSEPYVVVWVFMSTSELLRRRLSPMSSSEFYVDVWAFTSTSEPYVVVWVLCRRLGFYVDVWESYVDVWTTSNFDTNGLPYGPTRGSDFGRSKLPSKTAGTSRYQTNIYTPEESSQWALSNDHRWSLRTHLMRKLLAFPYNFQLNEN